jgi:hypothetical protein
MTTASAAPVKDHNSPEEKAKRLEIRAQKIRNGEKAKTAALKIAELAKAIAKGPTKELRNQLDQQVQSLLLHASKYAIDPSFTETFTPTYPARIEPIAGTIVDTDFLEPEEPRGSDEPDPTG